VLDRADIARDKDLNSAQLHLSNQIHFELRINQAIKLDWTTGRFSFYFILGIITSRHFAQRSVIYLTISENLEEHMPSGVSGTRFEIFLVFLCSSWRLCPTVGRRKPRWV